MPTITSLADTPLPTVVATFCAAFDDYIVKLPTEVAYWERRFLAARVDWALSFGVWDNDRLVAFIIQGIDDFQGHRTAFNTGTGVLPSHRGRGLVDALYAYALPLLRAAGVTRCALEVITENARAIRVYERIGFAVMRRVKCLRGTLAAGGTDLQVAAADFGECAATIGVEGRPFDSWDNADKAILAGQAYYATYTVARGSDVMGYFVMDAQSGYVARLEIAAMARSEDWVLLLEGISQIRPAIRLNDIDARRNELIGALLAVGLENQIDQFEMTMDLA